MAYVPADAGDAVVVSASSAIAAAAPAASGPFHRAGSLIMDSSF